jgi:heptosyltransferase-2
MRKSSYDCTVNMQRFTSTGLVTLFSRSDLKVGFDKNPLSWSYNKRISHEIGSNAGIHEADRNLALIKDMVPEVSGRVKLYPNREDFEEVKLYKESEYICIAPASLWFTKQFPEQKWIEFINIIDEPLNIYLLGSSNDRELCNRIQTEAKGKRMFNLAGQLSLLQTAALMKDAKMNFVNDSAPQHLASAVNAPVTSIFCSTVPGFGFGPLSDNAAVIETDKELSCRPCGLHGLENCPEGHFECALSIDVGRLKSRIL